MTETPLIARVALAETWFDAFRLVATPLFDRAAKDLGLKCSNLPTLIVNPPADWEERRKPCRRYALHFAEAGDWSLAGAWAMLAVDPIILPLARAEEEGLLYGLALLGVANAIADEPDLADDKAFCKAVFGWRFLERHGRLAVHKDEHDPIIVARRIAAPLTIDRDETLSFARAWAEVSS